MTNDLIVEWRWRWQWLQEMWSHAVKSRFNPNILARPSFVACIQASVAMILGREGDYECDMGWREVAWRSLGTYWTDYGTGQAWETLAVRGLRYVTWEDGNL